MRYRGFLLLLLIILVVCLGAGSFLEIHIKPRGSTRSEEQYLSYRAYWVQNQTHNRISETLISEENILYVRSIIGTPPPPKGDWIINDVVIIENEVLVVNGSIIVERGGVLVLVNSTLYMNVTTNGGMNITVRDGGNITVLNSTIDSYDGTTKFGFFIINTSSIGLINSTIRNVGVNDTFPGIYIDNSTVRFLNTEISSSYIGLYINSTWNVRISQADLSCSRAGILLNNTANISILNTSIYAAAGADGIIVVNSKDIMISNITLDNYGSNGINVYGSENILIEGCTFSGKNFNNHIFVNESSEVRIIANNIISRTSQLLGTKTKYTVSMYSSSKINISYNYLYLYSYQTGIAPPQLKLHQYCFYIADSSNIYMWSNYMYINVNASYSLPGIKSFTITQRVIYLLSSENITINNNTIINDVYFEAPTQALFPGNPPPTSKYTFQAVYISSSRNICLMRNLYGYISYYAYRSSSHQYLYVSSSEEIRVISEIYSNITKYTENIKLYNSSNIMAENLAIEGIGITFRQSNNSVATNITITNTYDAILISDGYNISIIGAHIYDSDNGMHIVDSNNIYLNDILIKSCGHAFRLKASSRLIFERVSVFESGFLIEDAATYNETTTKNCTYESMPLIILNASNKVALMGGVYGAILVGFSSGRIENIKTMYLQAYKCGNLILRNIDISGLKAKIEIISSENMTISGISIDSLYEGIEISFSQNIKILNLTVINTIVGVRLIGVTNLSVEKSSFLNVYQALVLQGSSTNITVINSTFETCTYAIHIINASDISILGNSFVGCSVSVMLLGSMPSSELRIISNMFTQNTICIQISYSSNVTIVNNEIAYNSLGIYVDYNISPTVTVAYNIIDNNRDALVAHNGSLWIFGNLFVLESTSNRIIIDRGVYCAFNNTYFGNYWENLVVVDANMDGILDEPFNVVGDYYDYYPLAFEPTILFRDGLICGFANNTYLREDHMVFVFTSLREATVVFTLDTLGTITINSPPYKYVIYVSLLNQTSYTLWINISDAKTYVFMFTFTVDVIAPEIDFSVANNSWLGIEAIITVNVSDSAYCKAEIYINDTQYMETTNESIMIHVSDFAFDNGYYILKITAYDLAGNQRHKTVGVYVDIVLPEMNISLANGSYVPRTATVNILCWDDISLRSLEVYMNNTLIVNITYPQIGIISVNLTFKEEGLWIVAFVLRDISYNSIESMLLVTVDMTRPQIWDIRYPQEVSVNEEYAVISFVINESSPLTSVYVEYRSNDSTYRVSAGLIEEKYYALIPIGAPGEIEFRVIAVDSAGNIGTTNFYIIEVKQPPQPIGSLVFALGIVAISMAIAIVALYKKRQRALISTNEH